MLLGPTAYFLCCQDSNRDLTSFMLLSDAKRSVNPKYIRLVLQLLCMTSGVYLEGGAMVLSPPPWSDCQFLDNFCTVFVSFISRLNRKIRVPRL